MGGIHGDKLPPAFADLVPFLEWAGIATQGARYLKRQQMPYSELETFYRAMAPRLDAIFAHLDGFGEQELPAEEARLFRMALGLIEAAQAVEIFGEPGVPHAPMPHRVAMSTLAGIPV